MTSHSFPCRTVGQQVAGSAGKAVCLAGRAQQTRYTVIDDSSHTIAVTGNHRQPALLSLENGQLREKLEELESLTEGGNLFKII